MRQVHAIPPHGGDTLMHSPFQVTVIQADQARAQVRAFGPLDRSTVHLLTAVLETLLGWGRRHVRLDMSGVTVSDPGCLPALVRVHEMFLAEHGLLLLSSLSPDLAALMRQHRLERVLFVVDEPQERWRRNTTRKDSTVRPSRWSGAGRDLQPRPAGQPAAIPTFDDSVERRVEGRVDRSVDLTGLLRSLVAGPTVEEAMRRLTEYTVEHIPAAEAAGLTVPTIAGPATRATTMSLADTVDALQYTLGGPCVTALLEPDAVQHADDLDAEHRWPEFASAAIQQTPVRSVLSYRLAVDQERPIASLNLYATRPYAFTPDTVRDTADLAEQATIALAYLAERRTRLELDVALHTNRRIGAALGILMARRGLTHEQAFLTLRQASQNSNRKLRDLAEDILETGGLPHIHPARRNAPGRGCQSPMSRRRIRDAVSYATRR